MHKIIKHPMDLGEFISWLGYWFYMGCCVGILNRRNWCSKSELTISVGEPFRLNKYMSRTRFEGILGYLNYTDQNDVECYDGLFHMSKMEEAWNLNTDEEFNSSWINALGKIMMEWFKKYAPRFMCVGSKYNPFGNERHTICCDLTSILWRDQIAEDKDRPRLLGKKEYNKLGKTESLILIMCRPIFGLGKAVVLYSGLCVAKGIT